MTFSAEVKNELCQPRIERKCCALAEAYGILLYCHSFSPAEIRIITSSDALSQRLPHLFKKAFGIRFDRLPAENAEGKRSFYITDAEKIRSIYDAFGSDVSTLSLHINFGIIEEPCDKAAFLRGAFLGGGSITDPKKRYHLELATAHYSVSREAVSVMREMGFDPKESQRRGNHLLYFKKADEIADVLTAMGATNATMALVGQKIEKEMNNEIMRKVNCDSANADKTVAAAARQMEAIRRIEREYGLDSLPEPLQEAALLRIANPEVSLSDLARLSYPPVSKSCLSHRLRKITEYKLEEDNLK
ncbi:MAG: DNA-binding protein WhiA [Bacillota bacterium]|nr:DNA-binding protein WhiA [Bacillota bacterium]